MIHSKTIAKALGAGGATVATLATLVTLVTLALILATPVQAGGCSHKPWGNGQTKGPGAKTSHPVLGNPAAPVKIVVYGDMQCPFTRRLMTKTLPRLVKAYPKKVQVLWRDNPLVFHKGALPAARVGREVFKQRGSKAFFAFQKLVFKNIRSINAANLVAWARQVGANSAKVTAVLAGTAHTSWIQQDQQSGKSRGVRGTPSSFVNGQNVSGSAPYKKFKAIVDSL